MKYVAAFVAHERKIQKMVDRTNKKVLKRCGAYVRKIARDFVRHKSNPNQASEPLHSPYDHFGLKRSINFGVDGNAVYIGPRHIRGGLDNVARLHEFGGQKEVKEINMELWKGVRLGMIAPVNSANLRRKDSVLRHDSRSDPKTGRKVFWVKIATKHQAEHSTRLYHRLVKSSSAIRRVNYPPRPYMAPALMKAMPHLPKLWEGSVK